MNMTPASEVKSCERCGADVGGRSRLKTGGNTYLCVDCHRRGKRSQRRRRILKRMALVLVMLGAVAACGVALSMCLSASPRSLRRR
jgi:hypothetical protein